MYNPDHIVKNITASDIEYYTCRVTSESVDGIPIIAAGESVNLATYNNMPRIFSCAELKRHILAGSIIFVHESVELSAAESLEYYMTMGLSKKTLVHNHKINITMNIVGFNRPEDLFLQMFKSNQVKPNTIYLALMMTIFLFFVPFVEKWIWSPSWTLVFFGAVVTLDFITAIAASNRGAKKKGKKTGFVTEKATRFIFVLAAYLILFAILNSLGKLIEALGVGEILNPIAFNYLAKFVFFLCFAINFVSALKHMSLMGLIPGQIAKFIEKFIDVHKNIINSQVEAIGEQRKNKDEGDGKPQS